MSGKRILLIVLAVAVAAFVAGTLRLVFFPAEDDPGRADAVVVLSGSKGERLDGGLALMRRGVAPVLVISGGLDPRQPTANKLCHAGKGDGFRVVCFSPDPDSTRGEAEEVGRVATEHGWRHILVVTSRFHVTRARMLFERCVNGDVGAVGVDYPWTSIPLAVAGEWFKEVRALTVARGC